MTRRRYNYAAFRTPFKEWTERDDISQRSVEVLTEPDAPKIKNYARTDFDSGEIRLQQVMRVECVHCHKPQEFAVGHSISPAVINGRFGIGDEVGALIHSHLEACAEADREKWRACSLQEELESKRFRPPAEWAEMMDEVMDGADD
jgi:hypothetical protein